MVRNINHNMSKPLVLTAVTIFICLVASVIVSFNTTNMIEVFAFPYGRVTRQGLQLY